MVLTEQFPKYTIKYVMVYCVLLRIIFFTEIYIINKEQKLKKIELQKKQKRNTLVLKYYKRPKVYSIIKI